VQALTEDQVEALVMWVRKNGGFEMAIGLFDTLASGRCVEEPTSDA
jgi:hypothetical protein